MGGGDDLAFPDPDELRAAEADHVRRGGAPDADQVRDLYAAAATITTCAAEQTALVVLAVKAGKGPSWLEYRAAYMRGRGISGLPRELGMLDRLRFTA
jgi:hypothetical protein